MQLARQAIIQSRNILYIIFIQVRFSCNKKKSISLSLRVQVKIQILNHLLQRLQFTYGDAREELETQSG